MDLQVEYQDISEENIKNGFDFAIPIGIFPDMMGINLCSVKGMEVTRQPDGQIVNIRIDFIPGED